MMIAHSFSPRSPIGPFASGLKKPFRATLAQKINAVKDWFELTKSDKHETEVAVEQVGQMLVDKGISPDVDTAIKTIQKLLNSKERIH